MKKHLLFAAAFLTLTVGLQAQNAPTATASSEQTDKTPAAYAVDGKANTRWSSKFADNQWLCVDLGSDKTVTGVKIVWETAFGKEFKIQVSADGKTWTDAFEQKDGKGKTETITFSQPQTGRYVRMLGLKRGTPYGFSIFEFAVLTK